MLKDRHLCIDARMLNCSGIGTLLKTVLSGLLKRESFQITALINKKDQNEDIFFNCKTIHVNTPIYHPREHFELAKSIPVCQVFWSPHFNAPLLPIRAKKRVVTIHDCYHLAYAHELTFVKRCFAHLFYNGAIALADCVATDSYFSKSQIEQYCWVKSKTCKVIPVGIDQKFFTPQTTENQLNAAIKYQLPEFFILAVGNVKPHKNLKSLVRAFEIVKKRGFEKLNLVIVGKKDGFISEDYSLMHMLKTHCYGNDIKFTGFVSQEDLPAIYSQAALFVFPSLYEGFGLPPLEAMACGCCVVASHRASIPEICQDAVHYVDPLNIHEMAQAIEELLMSPDKQVNYKIKAQQVLSKYLAEETIDIYEDLFKNLMEK